MGEIKAWAMAVETEFFNCGLAGSVFYLGAMPLGRSLVGVMNWADIPVGVASVCREDFGRDFRDLPEPLVISPGRMAWIDMHALGARWPVTDPDMDYRLVSEFSMWSADGIHWRFGTPDKDLGPVITRTALYELDK